MNFVYVSPHFPDVHEKFCRELSLAGVTVLGLGDAPRHELTRNLEESLTDYYQVGSLENYEEVYRAVAYFSYRYGKIDWLESNNEYWLELDARLRTDFNINTGIKSAEISKLKSKKEMKQIFEQAGIPTARQCVFSDLETAEAFKREVGFPLIAKPEIGVGALDTYKINDEKEWQVFLTYDLQVGYVLEEFIRGDIVSFDGIADGNSDAVFYAALIFPPSILDIMVDNKDLSYKVLREAPLQLKELGLRTIKAFNLKNRFFHLEFFRLNEEHRGLGKAGDYVALEVNMRPAGGNTPDMYNYANDLSVYRLYAELVSKGGLDKAYRPAPYYCVYGARRDEYLYDPSHDELLARYGDLIIQQGRNPEMSVPQMCNHYYLLRTADIEKVEAFEKDILRRIGGRNESNY
jgi:hypothetical protein